MAEPGIPDVCRAAIFDGPGRPLRIETVGLAPPPPGHILAKVRLATVCGSDLHTFTGKRSEPTPLILGHEILAEVAALGQGAERSAAGETIVVGDRISFTIMASCGACDRCRSGLPQKCDSLFKYGHAPFDQAPGLSGGFAEYIYLRPGTGVFHAPDGLSDAQTCPANCALATVVNAFEAGRFDAGDRVLVQGAGLLGLYAAALAREHGAGEVVVADVDERRLGLATRFGAGETLNVAGMAGDRFVESLGRGRFSCAIEVCGDPGAVWPGMRTLGLRGRYVIVGLVCAGSNFTVDGNTIARNYLTVKGIHNYAPDHLASALAFLSQTADRYPYEELVGQIFPLDDIQTAFERALNKDTVRIGVAP